MYHFRNDYSEGAHPRVLEALIRTNLESTAGYGEDAYCAAAAAAIRTRFGCPSAAVHFLVGGTQTNFTAIAAFLRPWEGVIAADSSHINGHEVGAVEATGHKILPVPTGPDGKITPEQIAPILERHKDPHLVKPRLVEIADATESGMVYTKAELEAIAEVCCRHNIYVIADEIYCNLVYDNNEFVSFASLGEDVKERTILVNGVSKSYAMTGWRIGYSASNPQLA